SIDEDSVVVKIRVGLIDNPGSNTPILTEKSIVNNKNPNKLKNNKLKTVNGSKNIPEMLNKKMEHSRLKRTPRDSIEVRNKLMSLWKKQKTIERDSPIFSCFPESLWVEKFYEDAKVTVKNNEFKILLGQTKYYQARYKTAGVLTIEEVPVDENGIPHLVNGGLAEDVWGSNPVTVIDTCNNCGKKMGVYWEKEKPMVNDSLLPTGLIRMVGKYWNPDSTYIDKLRAISNNDTALATVKVVKPDLLGNSTFATNWNNGIDVESFDYSVDSVCINLGGKYGFPPQYIKGQYSIESVYDTELRRVCPVFRYEPWSTQFDIQNNSSFKNGHFWVTWESMGNGDPVPNHNNTKFMTYVIAPHSVWYFINEYTNIVQNPPPYGGSGSLFGVKRISDNKLIFANYSLPRKEYKSIRNEVYQNLGLDPKNENSGANNTARLEFIIIMSTEYSGGLDSIPAQTRVASSFGPIQLLYGTATDRGYPQESNNPPENLNVMNTFWPLAMNHLKILLNRESGNNINNWPDGLEATLKNIYHLWNTIEDYPDAIERNITKFLPMKSEGE
ncbi:MAG TPA: hypothetical protein VLB50_05085, partial [Ignavibacteriaceae bacterium]|nr:hypothetical protein [Ignavibacteriaceae bacterium]